MSRVPLRHAPHGGACRVLTAAAWLVLALPAVAQPTPAAEDSAERLKRLIERIARTDGDASAEAARELAAAVTAPLGEALRGVGERPIEERVRLHAALQRLRAELDLRVFEAALPDEDRRLYESFREHYPDLVLELFHEHPDVRLAAVNRVPLEPGSGAGVLIAAKVNDSDGDVAEAALAQAAQLADPVVARGLARYVRMVTLAGRSGHFKPSSDVAIVLSDLVLRSIDALGQARCRESVPQILEAVDFFRGTPIWMMDRTRLATVAQALGRIGDERGAPLLVELVDESGVIRTRHVGVDRLATQTLGDVALLALARIYGIPPASLGFESAEGDPEFAGFASPDLRSAARRALLEWQRRNAERPAGEREPLPTAPREP